LVSQVTTLQNGFPYYVLVKEEVKGNLLRKGIGKGPFCFRAINDLGIGEIYDIPLHWILFITEEENVRTPDDLGRKLT